MNSDNDKTNILTNEFDKIVLNNKLINDFKENNDNNIALKNTKTFIWCIDHKFSLSIGAV